ncbi:MAG TPA: Asp23/Gls24 family envelope stress response protein [Clostridiales bacterium]|nr:Asp23/Gls24 family envelope stress response protein [Clostridiales bacterium]
MNKEFIEICTNDNGSIFIKEEVIKVIAANTTIEIDGVMALKGNTIDTVKKFIGTKSPGEGVYVERDSTGDVSLNIYISGTLEKNLKEVCQNVQMGVSENILKMTGLKVKAVNVYIESIIVGDREQSQKDE